MTRQEAIDYFLGLASSVEMNHCISKSESDDHRQETLEAFVALGVRPEETGYESPV